MTQKLKIEYIPIDKIRLNAYQIRTINNQRELEILAQSILDHGLIHPITVQGIYDTDIHKNTFELIVGSRRLKACKIAQLTEIPAIIVHSSRKDTRTLAFTENLHTQQLTLLEEAEGYKSLIDDYGYSTEELAKILTTKHSSIRKKIQILELPTDTKRKLSELRLNEEYGKLLLRLPDTQSQIDILDEIKTHRYTVNKTNELVNNKLNEISNKNFSKNSHRQKFKTIIKDIRIIKNTIFDSINMLKKLGVNATYIEEENQEEYTITIKVPMK
ncbi:MAG: hypothetical protein ATN36_01870 [Epulopiscium sp. Nele67-Bin005]|nr:MAG: hypothetical protein ATN36_01870 [Epulopiscium sp. Nele67-Bin005]